MKTQPGNRLDDSMVAHLSRDAPASIDTPLAGALVLAARYNHHVAI